MKFNNIKMKNFLSFGDYWSEISLTRPGLFLIVGNNQETGGSNGSGKSSIPDAIAWALFGKTIRDINIDQVANYLTDSETEVILEMSDESNLYKVVRYRNHKTKGNAVEFFENGEDKTAGHSKNTQALINKAIKMDWLGFVNSIVFSSDNMVSFIGLNNDKKKKMLESLLDLDLFSEYLSAVKNKSREIRDEIDKLERETSNKLALLNEEKSTREACITKSKSFEENRAKRIKNCDDLITEYNQIGDPDPLIEKYREIETLSLELTTLQKAIATRTGDKSKLVSQTREWQARYEMSKKEITKINQQIDHIEHLGNVCLECGSEITEGHRHKQTDKRKSEIEEVKKEQKNYGQKIIELSDLADVIEKELSVLKSKEKLIKQKITSITPEYSLEELMTIKDKVDEQKELKKSIVSEKNPYEEMIAYNEEKITRFSNELGAVEEKYKVQKSEQPYYKFWEDAFDKDGLKVYILESIIPILNERINFYLSQLFVGESIKLIFDKHLNETLIKGGIGGLNYTQNSQGERCRIDVAISLAIFDVMQMQRGPVSNVLFMDEVFDSGLDEKGVSQVFGLLKNMNTGTIFVISHRDTMADAFDGIIEVRKDMDGSKIVYR